MSTPESGDRGPLLGALLRMTHQQVVAHLAQRFEERGYVPLTGAVTQPLGQHPEGLRLTDLAAIAGVTKQTMAELVEANIAAGYVTRVTDPTDGRAKLLRLTPLGRKASAFAREVVLEVEARWASQIGRQRVEILRAILTELTSDAATAPRESRSRRSRRASSTRSPARTP